MPGMLRALKANAPGAKNTMLHLPWKTLNPKRNRNYRRLVRLRPARRSPRLHLRHHWLHPVHRSLRLHLRRLRYWVASDPRRRLAALRGFLISPKRRLRLPGSRLLLNQRKPRKRCLHRLLNR